jgi:hypothetical protein
MTAQMSERLRYEGEDHSMFAQPLEDFFELTGQRPDFECTSTALWRGYVGDWEIVADRLYLVGVSATLADGTPVDLETLFPGYPERVFAHWFSGTLRIPQGRRLKYVHMGWASTFERDLFLDLMHGVVVGRREQVNGQADDDAPVSKSPAGATMFPLKPGTGGSKS